MKRVNRMGSRTSLALWICLFSMCSLTCWWCWRWSTTQQPLLLRKWQRNPT